MVREINMIFGLWNDNLREKGWGGMDRIDLVQDRDRWRALVKW
jgi:hypothetical protein